MTTLTFPIDEPEIDPDRPGQWRLAQIELINWGTFTGHDDGAGQTQQGDVGLKDRDRLRVVLDEGGSAGAPGQRLEAERRKLEVEHRHRVVAGGIPPVDERGALAGNWTCDADTDFARHSRNDGLQGGCRRFFTKVPTEAPRGRFSTEILSDGSF